MAVDITFHLTAKRENAMGVFQTIDHVEFLGLLSVRLDAVRKGRMETHAQGCVDCANLATEHLMAEAITGGLDSASSASGEDDPYADCFFGSTLIDYSFRRYSDQPETSRMTDDEFHLIESHLSDCNRCRDLVEGAGLPLIATCDVIRKVAEDYRRHNRS